MIPGQQKRLTFAAAIGLILSASVAFGAAPAIQPVQPAGITQPVPSAFDPKALAVDAEEKVYQAKPGETNAIFVFNLTNTSAKAISINRVNTSCGCTLAKLPAQPWNLAPGESGSFSVNMDLRGKFGTLAKTVSIDSTAGFKMLVVKSIIPGGADPHAPNMNRQVNMQMAMADRQVIFKGDCASCHVQPAKGKKGKELYVAACGICHDAVHRASMVPDLRALKTPTSKEFWVMATTHGKPNTLMPAFAVEYGGILNKEEIASIADYLTAEITQKPVANNNLPFPKSIAVPGKTAPANTSARIAPAPPSAPNPAATVPPPPKPAFAR